MAELNSVPSHPEAESYASIAEADAYFEDRSGVESWAGLDEDKKAAALRIATKHIDSLRYHGRRLFPCPQFFRREQVLEFPRDNQRVYSGTVDSAAAGYIIDASLANQAVLPDDIFEGGVVIIISGTGKGQTLGVTAFEMSTGKITVDGSFSPVPDTTSQFRVYERIPDRVKYALFEQVLYILSGGGERQRMQAEGVTSYRIGDLSETFREGGGQSSRVPLCPAAKGHLRGLYSVIGVIE